MSRSIVATGLLLTAAGALAFGQTTNNGSLSGIVRDERGPPLPHASILAVNSANRFSREAKSGDTGTYRIDLLPAGAYTVRVSVLNFATSVSEKVEVAVNQTTHIDVVLTPGTQTENVTIEAAGALL